MLLHLTSVKYTRGVWIDSFKDGILIIGVDICNNYKHKSNKDGKDPREELTRCLTAETCRLGSLERGRVIVRHRCKHLGRLQKCWRGCERSLAL